MMIQISDTQRRSVQRYLQELRKLGRAVKRDRSALAGLLIITVFGFIAVFAPYLAPFDPNATLVTNDGVATLKEPNSVMLFGTNSLGRDIFSQWIYGSRVSLGIGLLAGLSVAVIGTVVGIVAGYYKGTVDLILMRVVDFIYGIPATPLIIVLALFFGASIWNIQIAFMLILWRTTARVIRSQTLSLSERPYVKSARAAGASNVRIMGIHIFPNLLPLILIQTVLAIGSAISIEAGISFLGLGATDVVSWGSMLQLAFATGAIREAWWWVIPPGVSITLLILAFFYLSRAVEEIANPEIKQEVG